MVTRKAEAATIQKDWDTNPRWQGVKRGYTAEDVVRLRGSVRPEYTLARQGAEKLWNLVNNEAYVNCLGALSGGQAMQQVQMQMMLRQAAEERARKDIELEKLRQEHYRAKRLEESGTSKQAILTQIKAYKKALKSADTEQEKMTLEVLINQSYGKLKEMEEDLVETRRLQKMIEDHAIANTSLTRKQLKENYDAKHDWFMNVKDALKYKVIDAII